MYSTPPHAYTSPPAAYAAMPGQPAHGSAHAQTQAAAHAQYAHAHAQQMAYAQAQAQQQAYYAQQGHAHAQAPAQAQQTHPRRAHKGTIPPGHVVRVGAHSVRVERYLSEGGYAHVYLTTSEQPIYPPKKSGTSSSSTHRWGEKGYTEHCLKRIAFEDDKVWADVSKEIEVMKALPQSPYLITYLDSSHHRLPNGTHEVFILMEYCSGGGIIDLLNKRLRDRLKEIEILNIFTDVCEAVADMHALPRPLLHRDLKIENVLSHPNGQAPTGGRPTPLIFKLCDFGSTTFPATHPPTTKAEADALALDLNKHTTLQYRSPEMVEPMLGWPVGLPSDVWALGVLLYKLCYYTTPFEEHGTLAIVNAKYTFPQYPVYSPRLQHLIASMLVEHPRRRPTVFEVLKVAHDMSGTRPFVDYPTSRSLPATIPSPKSQRTAQLANVLDFTDTTAARTPEPAVTESITPQRRGRPTRIQPPAPHVPAAAMPPVPTIPGDGAAARSSSAAPAAVAAASAGAGAAAAAAAKPNRLQLTGEGAQRQHQPSPSFSRPTLPAKQASVDAFGAPRSGGSGGTPTGFGDSFAAPHGAKSPTGSSGSGTGSGFGEAFGVTLKSTRPGGAPTGGRTFSDSFTGRTVHSVRSSATPGSATGSASGFGDAFTGGVGIVRPPQPTIPGAGGFGDSFTGSVSPPAPKLPPSLPAEKAASPPPTPPAKDVPSPAPMPAELHQAQAKTPSRMSFEQRFPSLEELHSGSPTSPTASKAPAVPTTKEEKPKPERTYAGERRRPSLVIPNLTGGDLAPNIRSPKVPLHAPMPQARSTQVTGTAFNANRDERKKSIDEGEKITPSTATSYLNYLNLMDDDDGGDGAQKAAALAAVDLMGDEESESIRVALAPLRPVLTKTPSSGAQFGVSSKTIAASAGQDKTKAKPVLAPKPADLSSQPHLHAQLNQTQPPREPLPPMSAPRPTTNMNSAQWSPLESAKSKSKSPSPVTPTSPTRASGGTTSMARRIPNLLDDSSDDDIGPESAAAVPLRRTVSRTPSPNIANRMSWFEGQRSSVSPNATAMNANANGSGNTSRPGSRPGSRPQSMFISGSPNAPVNANTNTEGKHQRRGSINDIVSRYEAMGIRPQSQGSQHAKPFVAPKPANLSTTAPSHIAPPPIPPSVPLKPQILRRPSGGRPMPGKSSSGSGGRVPTLASLGPGPAPGTASGNAGGLRRASTIGGGRSESSLPAPQAQMRYSPPSSTSPIPPSGATSRSSSPEKQQPVNVLIARWNKGQV